MLGGKTWKDIGQLAMDRGDALDKCSYQVDKIIEWTEKGPE
ncbi:hypothetical protein [Salmonella phage SE4]|nr:hypothetical protein HWC20_gp31 [Salmonella phage SE4]QEG07757.1 hypothetical protein [Salmonella phage SE4]